MQDREEGGQSSDGQRRKPAQARARRPARSHMRHLWCRSSEEWVKRKLGNSQKGMLSPIHPTTAASPNVLPHHLPGVGGGAAAPGRGVVVHERVGSHHLERRKKVAVGACADRRDGDKWRKAPRAQCIPTSRHMTVTAAVARSIVISIARPSLTCAPRVRKVTKADGATRSSAPSRSSAICRHTSAKRSPQGGRLKLEQLGGCKSVHEIC